MMLGNLIILLALVAVIFSLGWLTRRAGRIKRTLLKWPALLSAGLLTLVVALFTLVAYLRCPSAMPQETPENNLKIYARSLLLRACYNPARSRLSPSLSPRLHVASRSS
jgi:hypothetical protein